MNSDVDDTEKYLTKSSKNRTSNKLTEKLRQQTSHEDNEVTLEVEQNDEIGNICFNSTSVPDGIPGITEPPDESIDETARDYDDQIVVTLLPSTSDENASDKISEELDAENFSKLPSTSSEDIYLTSSSYSTIDTSHLSASQANDNIIYAELQITNDVNPPGSDYDVMSLEKLHPKRKEKAKNNNNKKTPLPATIEVMDDPVRNLWVTSKSHKKQLKDCGHSWRTGMWSKEETNILKQNIDRYCQKRGIADPTDIIFRVSKEDRRDFYPTISSGLNRPLFAVYRRVKRIYDQQNHKGRYSREEVDKLKRLIKIHGRDWTTIARQLGRSSDSVKDRVRLFKDDPSSGKWAEEEELRLASAVHSVTKTKRGDSVTDGIPWSAVADRVGTRTEKQCRSKWLNYLNWKLFRGSEWTKEDDKLLVQKIADRNPATENDINWSEISTGWSSVRSPTWLHKKWSNLKKILQECGLGDISFTDTVKLLNKLFSEDIFRVWEKPKQLIKFLVGVQKAQNLSDVPRRRIPAKKKEAEPVIDVVGAESPITAASSVFMQNEPSDQLITSQILALPGEETCVSMSQQSLNSIVRPRTGSESTQPKGDFDLPSSSATELVCEQTSDGSITLPHGTYQLTPTSSEGIFIIETAGSSVSEDNAMTGDMGRVVNITVSPEVLKTMLGQQSDELVLPEQAGQEYLMQTPSNSDENPVLSSVARDVIVNSIESDDDVSIYVT